MASILFDFYYRFYDRFMKTFRLDDHEAIVSRVQAFAGSRQLKIADIGGATGLLAHVLIQLGHEVTIIDPAKKMTAIAKNRNSQVIVINESLQNANPGRTYDLIIVKDCFHHIKTQLSALEKIWLILEEGGLLLIQDFFPDNRSAKNFFLLERCCWEKVYPLYPPKLVRMMEQTNFSSTVSALNKRDYLVTGLKNNVRGEKNEQTSFICQSSPPVSGQKHCDR